MTQVTPVEFSVRPATLDDLPELILVVNHYVRENRLLPRTMNELQDLIPTGFVAVSENSVVGFAALEIYSQKLAEIRSLAVKETMQGRGVGSMLVDECVRLARSRRILEVMAVTSSDDFFLSCGFDFTLPGEKKALFLQTRETGGE
jgi:amino-acid N-acetyltransferase